MTSKQIIELIKRQAGLIEGKIIKDLIAENEPIKKRTMELYNAYKGDVEIKHRQPLQYQKLTDNRLANDFRGNIINEVVSYMFGNPIVYKLNGDTLNTATETEFKRFSVRNNLDDLDSLTGEMASICGFAARLLYVDTEGKERVMNINPWECIFIEDSTIDEVQYGLIYYKVTLVEGDKKVERHKAEWYDKTNVTFYIETEKGDFIRESEPIPHMFDFVPLLRFPNNDLLQGDFEKVNSLIDAYDKLVSDCQNETEQFRMAYFTVTGGEITAEVLEEAKRTGALVFPENMQASYLTKDLNGIVGFIENQKKTLNENIYKFSDTVDMRDENFSGAAMSGESRKWKLVGLEGKAIKKERKFTKSTRQMLKVLGSAWAKKNIKFNYEDVELQFTRNLPVDMLYWADVSMKLKGMVSERKRLSLLPFVKDVEAEIKQMEEEAPIIDLSDPTLNEPEA